MSSSSLTGARRDWGSSSRPSITALGLGSCLSGALGLLDGGDFIAEVTEAVGLGQDFQEYVCPLSDWLDVFVVPSKL